MNDYSYEELMTVINTNLEWCLIDGTPGDDSIYAEYLNTLSEFLVTSQIWKEDLNGAWDGPADIVQRIVARALKNRGIL